MSATLIRKCAFCGEDIVLTKDDMHMVSYKKKSYHTECFKTMCNGRVLKNNRYSSIYSDALQNLDQLESEAKKKLMHRFVQDELNEYLLKRYNVFKMSERFWSTIQDLEKGKFKCRACHPVDIETLYSMWKYYQKDLDKIHEDNEKNGKQMYGEPWAFYDLSVVLNQYSKYQKMIKDQKKQNAAMNALYGDKAPIVDSTKIGKTKFEQKRDISDLFE